MKTVNNKSRAQEEIKTLSALLANLRLDLEELIKGIKSFLQTLLTHLEDCTSASQFRRVSRKKLALHNVKIHEITNKFLVLLFYSGLIKL